MSLPKMSTLVKVAGTFGIGIGIMGVLLNRETNKLVNQAKFVQIAVETMKSQPTVKELLGSEITAGRATLNNDSGDLTKHNIKVVVPLKGENDSARLYAYARRKGDDDNFRLYKLEASFTKIEGKKLILMDRTNEEDIDEMEQDGVKKRKRSVTAEQVKEEEPSSIDKRALYKEQMKNWKFPEK